MKKCKNCGKEFKAGYKGRKTFCSKQCGVKWWSRKYKRVYKRNTKCIVCGKPIMPNSYKYCSEECRKLQATKRASGTTHYRNQPDDNKVINMCLSCDEPNCDGTCKKVKFIKSTRKQEVIK